MKGLQQLLSLFAFLLHISWKKFVTATGKRSFIIVVRWKRREEKINTCVGEAEREALCCSGQNLLQLLADDDHQST